MYIRDNPDDILGVKKIAATYCIDNYEECASEYALEKFVNVGMYDALMLMALRGGRGKAAVTAGYVRPRLPQDVTVNPVPPAPLKLNRPIGRASHNRALQAEIKALPSGAQVNAQGVRVGVNRPDLQYTLKGQRYCIEYDGPANP